MGRKVVVLLLAAVLLAGCGASDPPSAAAKRFQLRLRSSDSNLAWARNGYRSRAAFPHLLRDRDRDVEGSLPSHRASLPRAEIGCRALFKTLTAGLGRVIIAASERRGAAFGKFPFAFEGPGASRSRHNARCRAID